MFQLYSTFLAYQKIIFRILILTNLVLAEERPRSALEWITVSEAEKLPNGLCNEDLVHLGEGPCISKFNPKKASSFDFISFNLFNPRSSMFCRAMKDGCTYPGEAMTWQDDGLPYTECRIRTKEKVYELIDNFQLLYDPNGAAQISWLPWDQGTGNVNFPTEVVKSDESQSCNFMLARYNDFNELGYVDSQGYVYYTGFGLENWYWDDNEYDLLIERPAKGG
jgi:hypothetical protein